MARLRSSAAIRSHRIRNARPAFVRIKNLPFYIFLKELFANPRNIGAACPSSKKLAEGIASFVPKFDSGYVVELGAGTGVVTSALLRRGIDPERLIVIEKSVHLTRHLREKFPHVKVIQGDAAALDNLLLAVMNCRYAPVTTIVSSLPLRSLPENAVHRIARQIERIVTVNGSVIQFTYDIRPSRMFMSDRFTNSRSKIVWRNLPPARINIYRKTAQHIL